MVSLCLSVWVKSKLKIKVKIRCPLLAWVFGTSETSKTCQQSESTLWSVKKNRTALASVGINIRLQIDGKPSGIVVVLIMVPMHRGKLTLSFLRRLCSGDVILVVTTPPSLLGVLSIKRKLPVWIFENFTVECNSHFGGSSRVHSPPFSNLLKLLSSTHCDKGP